MTTEQAVEIIKLLGDIRDCAMIIMIAALLGAFFRALTFITCDKK